MPFDPPANLMPYSASVETVETDEAETAQALNETMLKVREKTLKDGGHAIRSVHAKSHGLLEGELEIYGDLPVPLAQGLFAKPGRYPVVLRYSTVPGDVLDDSVSTPRGLALKIIGVEGERAAGSEGDVTQDFVMVNGPAFSAPNAKVFLANLKLLAATTDVAEGAKKAASAVFRGLEHVVEAFGGKSPTLASLGGQAETHILGDNFYTQVPVRYGDYVAKISVAPATPELQALTDAPLKLNGEPTGLRDAVVDFFRSHGGAWDLRVQLATNQTDTPVENANKEWSQDDSPYLPVGRITVKPQTAWSEARSEAVDDGMAFSPWHALAAHRPLGQIMRVRKLSYDESARFRAEHNHKPVAEPREAVNLPG